MPSSDFPRLGAKGAKIASKHQELALKYFNMHARPKQLNSVRLYRGWDKFSVFGISYSTETNSDGQSWVIAGDGPPIMVSADGCPSGAGALSIYANYLKDWSEQPPGDGSARSELQSLLSADGSHVTTFDANMARALAKRSELIVNDILPAWREDDILGRDATESDPGYD